MEADELQRQVDGLRRQVNERLDQVDRHVAAVRQLLQPGDPTQRARQLIQDRFDGSDGLAGFVRHSFPSVPRFPAHDLVDRLLQRFDPVIVEQALDDWLGGR